MACQSNKVFSEIMSVLLAWCKKLLSAEHSLRQMYRGFDGALVDRFAPNAIVGKHFHFLIFGM